MYNQFDVFSLEKLSSWAVELGIAADNFATLMKDGETRKMLVNSKKEGIVNGVEATPTLFINGRKYVGDVDIYSITDALEEEVERLKK